MKETSLGGKILDMLIENVHPVTLNSKCIEPKDYSKMLTSTARVSLIMCLSAPICIVAHNGAIAATDNYQVAQGFGLPIPGLTGGSFSTVAAALNVQLKTALVHQARGMGLVHQAIGNKVQADKLIAISNEISALKTLNTENVKKVLGAIADNPVDRSIPAKQLSDEAKSQFALGTGNVAISLVYDVLAIATAKELGTVKPGPLDALNAPMIIQTATYVVTALPTQLQNMIEFKKTVDEYSKTNNITPISKEQILDIAKKTNPNAAADAARY